MERTSPPVPGCLSYDFLLRIVVETHGAWDMRVGTEAARLLILTFLACHVLTAPAGAQSIALAGNPADLLGARVSGFWSLLSRTGGNGVAPLIAPDFSGVSREGRLARAEEIAALAQMHVTEFAIAGLRVTELGASTASAEYCLILKGRIGDADLSGVYYMSDIWRETAGDWLLWRRSEILAAP